MVQGCGVSCIKALLFIFNFVFAICGIAIMVCGGISLHFLKGTEPLVGPNYIAAPIILIIVGGVVFLLAFLGCCGASQESYCMLTSFSSLLFVLLCAEIAVCVLAFIYKNRATDITGSQLRSTMRDYYRRADHNPVREAWDFVQTKLECCGVTSYQDWPNETGQGGSPDSCGLTPIFRPGCLNKMIDNVEKFSIYVAIAALIVGAIEIVGIIFACCLAQEVK